MPSSPLMMSCDDNAWPDFLGFTAAIEALTDGSLLDALEQRICAVENAGLDSVGSSGIPDKNGRHTQDAGIMTGWNRLTASIGALDGYQNPFRVARLMWDLQERGLFPHNFLVDQGAALFAQKYGAKTAVPSQAKSASGSAHDTVGCIVFDGNRWAVGTSTSGWGGKEPGRIGDAPVPGGGFCANAQGAAFCTWTGEIATRLNLAGRVMTAIEMGRSVEDAVQFAFSALTDMANGYRGPVILHVATGMKAAVVGVGFENDIVPATYSFWRKGMSDPQRRPVPAWNPALSVPVF